jgi:hypothetical protein
MLGPAFFDIPVGMLQNIGLQERDTPAVLDAIELQNKHRIGIVLLPTPGPPRLNDQVIGHDHQRSPPQHPAECRESAAHLAARSRPCRQSPRRAEHHLLMDDAHHGDFTPDQPVKEMLPRC